MHTVSLDEFSDAVEFMGLISLTSASQMKHRYLELSKLYHPDVSGGSHDDFQKLQESYEIIKEYIENFRYVFDADEFKRQNPILASTLTGKHQIK